MSYRQPRSHRSRNQYARTLLYDKNAVPSFAVSQEELEKWRQYFIKNKIPTFIPPSPGISFGKNVLTGSVTSDAPDVFLSALVHPGEIPYKIFISGLSTPVISHPPHTQPRPHGLKQKGKHQEHQK